MDGKARHVTGLTQEGKDDNTLPLKVIHQRSFIKTPSDKDQPKSREKKYREEEDKGGIERGRKLRKNIKTFLNEREQENSINMEDVKRGRYRNNEFRKFLVE